MWKPSGSTSVRRASSPSNASAGGQDEQPCEVNSSTTTGRGSATAGVAATASPRIRAARRIFRRFVIAFSRIALDCALICIAPRKMPITLARAAPRDPSADQPLLRGQIVLDEGGDDLVDVAVAGEAEGFGARRQQRLRPARDNPLDLRVRLPADPG